MDNNILDELLNRVKALENENQALKVKVKSAESDISNNTGKNNTLQDKFDDLVKGK